MKYKLMYINSEDPDLKYNKDGYLISKGTHHSTYDDKKEALEQCDFARRWALVRFEPFIFYLEEEEG